MRLFIICLLFVNVIGSISDVVINSAYNEEFVVTSGASRKDKLKLIERHDDIKIFKKYLRTHTNVLVVYGKSGTINSKDLNIFADVAEIVKGIASIVFIDCKTAKKLCKKMKVKPTDFEYKHYKDGEFNKDYDRKMTVKSMVAFLNDPTGDLPWDEDDTAVDIVHLENSSDMSKQFKKDKRPTLVMFYAPWCGFCKKMKPDYTAAATELKDKYVLAAMDLNKPENLDVKTEYNVTGFPTLLYFASGKNKYIPYGGETTKDGFVKWMDNPQPPKEKEKEKEWADDESEVVHLTDSTFDVFIATTSSVLVMFYAPWCGHCKAMKPDYVAAAEMLIEENINGKLAAVDATKHQNVSKRFDVKGFPTVKYFKDGILQEYDVNERTKEKIVEFMKDPKAPPPPEPEWHETSTNIQHLDDETFKSHLKKKKHALVMYYAPWCGHCKNAKPEFESAAEEMKDNPKISFSAVNCIKSSSLCSDVNGYPTFKYYNYGKIGTKYAGGRLKADFVKFMSDPNDKSNQQAPPPAEETPEAIWADIPNSEHLSHLTEKTFDDYIKTHKSVLVMFYAPWCGHCKAMKPDYAKSANILITEHIEGNLATVDVTTNQELGKKHNIKGYPTLLHFKNGKYNMQYNRQRTPEDFVDFMKNDVNVVHKHDDL